MKEQYEEKLLGGTLTVSFKGKKLAQEGWDENELYSGKKAVLEEVSLKAIPYSSWNNRTPGEMLVWMKEIF